MVIAGLMAKELGGGSANVIGGHRDGNRAGGVGTRRGISVRFLRLFVVVLLTYFLLRLLKTEDARLWLAIGAVMA